jgi:ubiquinone/menaquinone biosynthesis C-methylase UbiE
MATPEAPSAATARPPPVVLLQMIAGFWLSRALYLAAKLGLADLLQEGPKSSADLAQQTGTHAPSLYRVLRALASVGVFTEDAQRRFALTPLGETLRSDVPGSLRAFTISELGEDHYPAWGEVLHSVRTGEIAFDHLFGMDVWQYRAQHPDEGRIFDAAMASFSSVVNAAIVASYDFSAIGKIVDVGGGDGSLIAAILKAYPGMKGVLFDLPHVSAGARRRIEAEGVAERCEVVAGDAFTAVPSGGDAYLLKWIIHDWDDERSVALLKNCHRVMPAKGKLLLVEAIIPAGDSPSFHKFMDLNMLVMTGGRERTEAEYRSLLDAAGFSLQNIISTQTEMSVLEAVRR